MSLATPVYTDFEPSPDDNQAPPPLGAPEGNYKGSNVNDTFRVVMSAIRNLGDSSLLLSSGVFTAASKRITNLAAATARTDAVNLGQVQDSAGIWGGTTGGSANAQTLTASPALTGGYRAGQRFRGVWGFTNTAAMTVNVNGNGEVALTDPYGNALVGGEAQEDRRFTIEHDGTALRLLDPSNWMDQVLYDLLWPVGRILIENNESAPSVPKGVTATWTRILSEEYLRITAVAPATGGSLNTSSAGAHDHGGTTGDGGGNVNRDSGGNDTAAPDHDHPITEDGAHTHTIEPTYRSFAVWARTA